MASSTSHLLLLWELALCFLQGLVSAQSIDFDIPSGWIHTVEYYCSVEYVADCSSTDESRASQIGLSHKELSWRRD